MVKDIKIISEIHTSERKRTTAISFLISIIILVVSADKIIKNTDIKEYIENQMHDSNFISKEYVDPKEVNIQFGDEKRNLIYIFLESMETTYFSIEDGGLSEEDLMPEIAKLAKENTNFSNTDNLGGAYTLYGTTWTVGAMSAQTAGVPLKLSIGDNSLGEYSSFLSGAYSIGEVLQKNGYTNFLLLGSDATFGGRKNLFKQHGNYEIWDFESALEENLVSEKIWWGYTDDMLFEIAKQKILNLSSQEEPFNFTMLTADTHFPDGCLCKDCKEKWDEQYKNVISCSSKRVGDFIKWIQEQDFYDNTTIVIAGDHLTMQSNFFELEEGQEYDKTVVSVIINPAIESENTKNRQYSTMDLYPTTLAALGATIEGDKLALGTNLFSDEQTLIEKYGIDYVNNELMKTSKYYDNHILVSK
jgi:phosphoglycerol transferase